MARPAKQNHNDYEIVEPGASAMVESLRAFGYSTPTAIADLIDNSITAKASKIWINFFWDGPRSYVSVLDDGHGMTEDELTRAMKAGGRSPLEERSQTDLGRFGLGLKTASFSQCRQLTVSTKKSGADTPVTRRWDLDHVRDFNEWRLLKGPANGSENRFEDLDQLKQGTMLLWESMDRLVSNTDVRSEADHSRFRELIDEVKEHLGMVFHRFLRPTFQIFINGKDSRHLVRPWDPFLCRHDATQQFPPEPIRTPSGDIIVYPFVLPHKDKLGEKAYLEAAGHSGWNAQQGFYVYRNERLLVAGDWLGLGYTKEEHYKLARIQVDLPNTMDNDWDIDVKKSRARPPGSIRDRLRAVADLTRARAVEVYRHRGKYGARKSPGLESFAWLPNQRNGKVVYSINRNHPLVNAFLTKAGESHSELEVLFRLLEESVPIRQIWLDAAQKPDCHSAPFEDVSEKDVKQVIVQVFQTLQKGGHSPKSAKTQLSSMETFSTYPHLIATLTE